MKLNPSNAINCLLGTRGSLRDIDFVIDGTERTVSVPDDQLFISVKDMLINREYEHFEGFDLKKFTGKKIVDAGAHVGLFSIVAGTFASEVIAFEPDPKNYALLKANVARNGMSNVKTINKAVWHTPAKLKFYSGARTSDHSLYAHYEDGGFYYVDATSIADVIREYGPIDLLKIDIEGAEFDVFSHIDESTLKNIGCIVAEVHLAKTNRSDADGIIKKLRANGFEVQTAHPPFYSHRGSYAIKLKGQLMLKLIRASIYSVASLLNIHEKGLLMLYAKKK